MLVFACVVYMKGIFQESLGLLLQLSCTKYNPMFTGILVLSIIGLMYDLII